MDDTQNFLDSLSSKMADLKNSGYKTEFRLENNKLFSPNSGKFYEPTDISIDNTYRFEGESNPSDMSILYAVESKDGEKGMVVDGFGISGDVDLNQFMANIH